MIETLGRLSTFPILSIGTTGVFFEVTALSRSLLSGEIGSELISVILSSYKSKQLINHKTNLNQNSYGVLGFWGFGVLGASAR